MPGIAFKWWAKKNSKRGLGLFKKNKALNFENFLGPGTLI